MKALTRIPDCDEPTFAQLPDDVKREFNYVSDALPYLLAKKSLLAACTERSSGCGLPVRALYNRVRKYLESGDWRDLCNGAKAGPILWEDGPALLTSSFKAWCKGIFERFQKNNAAGYREIIFIWKHHVDSEGRAVKKIPGYEEWPIDSGRGYPRGWSYRNLLNFAPENWDAAAARQGLFAASQFRPPVRTTRSELKILERAEFDDHEWNLRIHFPGQRQGMRPRGFLGVEGLSDYKIPAFKPTIWDPEAEMKKALTKFDFMWFVIEWLCRVGYRTDKAGTWLFGELGTAVFDKEFVKRIWRVCNEHVHIVPPSVNKKTGHGGQFGAKGGGDFKHKPHVEQSFALIDTYFSGLPAQTGIDRVRSPEDSGRREQYLGALLRSVEKLAREGRDASGVKLPVLVWKQFLDRARDLMAAINETPDHKLEGWTELGFHLGEYRLPLPSFNSQAHFTPWMPQDALLQMKESERAAITALIGTDAQVRPAGEELTRARNMSRAEVFHRERVLAVKRGEVTTVTPWRFCELIGLENGFKVTVNKQNQFKIDDRRLGIRPLYYLASINNRHLPVGESYLVFVNPWSPRTALLCHDDGAAVGLIEQWDMPACNDTEAVMRVKGKQAHWEAQNIHDMEARHRVEADEREHMIAHNAAVLAGKLPGEKELAEQDLAARADAALCQTQD